MTAALRNAARVCAWWTVGAGLLVILVRSWRFQHRWYLLTIAALLQVALHGFFGMSYLLAGLIAVIFAAIGIAAGLLVRPKTPTSS